MVTAGILPFRENSHGRTGNWTRDLMISSQRLWPLDHEAGLFVVCSYDKNLFVFKLFYVSEHIYIIKSTKLISFKIMHEIRQWNKLSSNLQ